MHLEPVDVSAYTAHLRSPGLTASTAATKKLLIFAGVHGNEFAAALAVKDVVAMLANNPDAYKQWSVRILTPLNPVGLAYGSRYDHNGYDINRDFKDFKTVGARVQRDAIEDFKPDILVTLHQSPEQGFFMFSEGTLPAGASRVITDALNKYGVTMAQKTYFGTKAKTGIWQKPRLAYVAQAILGMHTLGKYAHACGIPTITTESTWTERDVARRRAPHVLTVTAILENPELF